MDLPRRVSGWPFAGMGEEEPSRGQLLARLGQEGAAARPLDGGVLTRWGARASARGPATAPWLPRSSALISRPRCLAVDALRGEENVERESIEREEGGANELGFFGGGRRSPF